MRQQTGPALEKDRPELLASAKVCRASWGVGVGAACLGQLGGEVHRIVVEQW